MLSAMSALQGGRLGAPDSSTRFPATTHVAYIKVWQRSDCLGR